MSDIQYFAKKKGSIEPPKPIKVKGLGNPSVKGLLHYKPSPFEYSFGLTPSADKCLHAFWYGYQRITPIKRTRKRQIKRAKWMMVQHDHTCVEWSQWWHKTARKPKRWSE